EYKSRLLDVQQAEQKLDAVRHAPDASYSDVVSAAQRATAARANLSKLESDTLSSDANIVTARQTYREAMARTSDLRRQFEAGISSDPDWRAARAKLDTVRSTRVALVD